MVTSSCFRLFRPARAVYHAWHWASAWMLFVGCLAVCPVKSAGQTSTIVEQKSTPSSTLDQLTLIRSNLALIEQLRNQGVEVDADRAIERRLLNDAARATDGRVNSVETLRAATGTAPTARERQLGWFTFFHVLWLIGAFVVLAALVILFRHYLERLIKWVPVRVWEVLLYSLCVGAIVAGRYMPAGFVLAPVMLGCLGLLGCFYFSKRLHRFQPQGWMAWLFVLAWGAAALVYHDENLGFMTVVAALAGLGFYAAMIPGVVMLGFRNSDVISRATTAAGLMLAVHVALHCWGAAPPFLAPFRTGMGFLGAFVYLLGLLIMSNIYYARRGWPQEKRWPRYFLMQVLTIASGVATIYFGTVYRVDALLGIGGTYFCLYLMEKYCELPWRGIGWAWALLGTGGLLYGFSLFAQARPEWFLFKR